MIFQIMIWIMLRARIANRGEVVPRSSGVKSCDQAKHGVWFCKSEFYCNNDNLAVKRTSSNQCLAQAIKQS